MAFSYQISDHMATVGDLLHPKAPVGLCYPENGGTNENDHGQA
jgi:hypothetical protein